MVRSQKSEVRQSGGLVQALRDLVHELRLLREAIAPPYLALGKGNGEVDDGAVIDTSNLLGRAFAASQEAATTSIVDQLKGLQEEIGHLKEGLGDGR